MSQRATSFSSINFKVVTLALLGLVVAFAGIMALAAGPAQAGAKYKQSNCKKLTKKMKKAKGKKKARLKSKVRACKKNRKVYNRIKDSRFVGTRSDGFTVDLVLCANGKMADDYGTDFETIYLDGWKVNGAKVKGKFFEAGVAARISSNSARVAAIKRDKDGWQVGVSSFDGSELDRFGPGEKTDAKKICRSL